MAYKRETYIKVAGHGKYFYRVVDSASYTVDFLLTAKRDLGTARRFLERAITLNVVPEKIIIDKCGANTAAIGTVYAHACVDILMRQNKHLNNTVEQDPPSSNNSLVQYWVSSHFGTREESSPASKSCI